MQSGKTTAYKLDPAILKDIAALPKGHQRIDPELLAKSAAICKAARSAGVSWKHIPALVEKHTGKKMCADTLRSWAGKA